VQARERAFIEIEEERRKNVEDNKSKFLSLPEPKPSPADSRPPLLTSGNTVGLPHVKTERVTRQVSSPFLNPTSDLYYHAFPGKMKTAIKTETPSAQETEELMKVVFKLQHTQIRSMVSSQQQLATTVTLPQPEVPWFTRNPMHYKMFIMAFDVCI